MHWWSWLCSQAQTTLNEILQHQLNLTCAVLAGASAFPGGCAQKWISDCVFRSLAFQIYFIDRVSSFISLRALLWDSAILVCTEISFVWAQFGFINLAFSLIMPVLCSFMMTFLYPSQRPDTHSEIYVVQSSCWELFWSSKIEDLAKLSSLLRGWWCFMLHMEMAWKGTQPIINILHILDIMASLMAKCPHLACLTF